MKCRIFASYILGFIMNKYETLNYKISARIARKKDIVFLRKDFVDLGGYDRVRRILRNLVRDGKIIKIGDGLYTKAKKSSITEEVIPVASFAVSVRRASILPAASSGFHLTMDTLAVRLTIPPAEFVRDLQPQVNALYRAHKARSRFRAGMKRL